MALFKSNKNNAQRTKVFTKDDPKKILSPESPFVVKEAYSAIRTNLLSLKRAKSALFSLLQAQRQITEKR